MMKRSPLPTDYPAFLRQPAAESPAARAFQRSLRHPDLRLMDNTERAGMEGRRSANVIAQGQRGTSAALGHAVAMGEPCKGAIELGARGCFALAGLHRSLTGTQGCARSSLTLGYNIAGLSALSLDQLSITPLRLVGNAESRLPHSKVFGGTPNFTALPHSNTP